MTDDEKKDISIFLDTHSTLSLATVDKDHVPHVAPVFYAHNHNWGLLFISQTSSKHSQSLALNPVCAASIYQDEQERDKIKGLQLHGCCRLLSESEDEQARLRYLERYPFVKNEKSMFERFQMMGMYVFEISWMRLIDNSKGFGFKQEWALD